MAVSHSASDSGERCPRRPWAPKAPPATPAARRKDPDAKEEDRMAREYRAARGLGELRTSRPGRGDRTLE